MSSLSVKSSGMFSNFMFSRLEYASRYKFSFSISLSEARSLPFSSSTAASPDSAFSFRIFRLSDICFLSSSFEFRLSLRSSTSRLVVVCASSSDCILLSSFSKDVRNLF